MCNERCMPKDRVFSGVEKARPLIWSCVCELCNVLLFLPIKGKYASKRMRILNIIGSVDAAPGFERGGWGQWKSEVYVS